VNDGDGGFGPGGGGGGKAEGEFDVVAEGQHVRAGRPSPEPNMLGNKQAGADAPGHGVAAGRQSPGLVQILADGTESTGQRPGNRLGNFLQLSGLIDQKRGDGAGGVLGGGGQ